MTALHKREIARGFMKPHHIHSRDELEKPKRHNKRSENRLHQNCIQFEWTCVSGDDENLWQNSHALHLLCTLRDHFDFMPSAKCFRSKHGTKRFFYKLSNVLNKISFNQNMPFHTFNMDAMKGTLFLPQNVMPTFQVPKLLHEILLFLRCLKKFKTFYQIISVNSIIFKDYNPNNNMNLYAFHRRKKSINILHLR